MTDQTPNTLAAAFGSRQPYDHRAVADEVFTLEHFDAPAKSYRVGDCQGAFVNISFREGSWARSYLHGMKTRHDSAQAEAVSLINRGGDRDTIARIFDAWAERHAAASIGAIKAHASMASAMVTGPSNFPVRRSRKQWDAADRRAERIEQMLAGVKKRMKRAAFPHGAPGEAIRSSNPDAAELLAAKVQKLEAERDLWKATNAAWRKAGKPGIGDEDGWARFSELAEALGWKPSSVGAIRAGCERHYMAKHRPMPPAESYVLTNLGARIKQAQARMAEVQAMPSADHEAEEAHQTRAGEVTVVENGEAARIQLLFPGKPDAETRSILKRFGFRWASSQSAWQRHLNDNGRRAARMALEALKGAE